MIAPLKDPSFSGLPYRWKTHAVDRTGPTDFIIFPQRVTKAIAMHSLGVQITRLAHGMAIACARQITSKAIAFGLSLAVRPG